MSFLVNNKSAIEENSVYKEKKISENKLYKEKKHSASRNLWIFISRLCTLFIPDILISYFPNMTTKGGVNYENDKPTSQQIQAWREKVTLCILVGILSSILIFYLWFFGTFLCPNCKILSISEFQSFDVEKEPHVIIYGRVFDLKKLALFSTSHKGYNLLSFYAGKDASDLFPQELFNLVMAGIGLISIHTQPQEYDSYASDRYNNPIQLSSTTHRPLDLAYSFSTEDPQLYPMKVFNPTGQHQAKRTAKQTILRSKQPFSSEPSSISKNTLISLLNLLENERNLEKYPVSDSSLFGIDSIANIDLELSSIPFHPDSPEMLSLLETLSNCWVADVGWNSKDLLSKGSSKDSAIISIDGILFDITTLLPLREELSNSGFDGSNLSGKGQNRPLVLAMTTLPWSGSDHTSQLLKVINTQAQNRDQTKNSNKDFRASYLAATIAPIVGVIDPRSPIQCAIGKYVLLASSALMLLVTGIKFLAALQLGRKREPEILGRHTILQLTCFTEGEIPLRKAINSLISCEYDDRFKLLWIICDGIATGQGNDRPTARILIDILGIPTNSMSDDELFSVTNCPKELSPALAYDSLGGSGNYARVWAGHYFFNQMICAVPFVLIVKIGTSSEQQQQQDQNRKAPGNRGKRDSQLILLRWLSKLLHTNTETMMTMDTGSLNLLPDVIQGQFTPLEQILTSLLTSCLRLDPLAYEYLLMVDADTECAPDALTRLVSVMLGDRRVIGVCGETTLANPRASWVTAIQVYEYYITHNLSKAFESLFGVVTCLPGCFSLFRLRSSGVHLMTSFLLSPALLEEYGTQEGCGDNSSATTLHRRNLLTLGEDRYLTTLLLKHFPSCKTSFSGDAICKTNAPEQWNVFLSQRRRWINSTVHNLWELLSIPRLWTLGSLSLKFIVLLDLNSTLVMPATMAYLMWCIGRFIESCFLPEESNLSSVTSAALLLALASFSMQVCVFMLKRKWFIIGWMFLYLLSLPIFFFALPLYAFWHFDDFSWGRTRKHSTQGFITATPVNNTCSFSETSVKIDEFTVLKQEAKDKPFLRKKVTALMHFDSKSDLTLGKEVSIDMSPPLFGRSVQAELSNTYIINTAPQDIQLDKGDYLDRSTHSISIDNISLSSKKVEEIEYVLKRILASYGSDSMSLGQIRELVEKETSVDLSSLKEWFSSRVEFILTIMLDGL